MRRQSDLCEGNEGHCAENADLHTHTHHILFREYVWVRMNMCVCDHTIICEYVDENVWARGFICINEI